jgi:ABC-type transport system substrate-binding protein
LTPKYEARGVYLYKDVDVSSYYAVFNMEDPVVGGNRKLRQAISLAYDEGLANKLFRNGIDLSAEQVIPPGVFGHDPDYRNPFKGPDLTRARRLLEEAGYPGGIDPATGSPLELTLDLVADNSQARQMAEFEKNQIEQIGVRVKIEENTWPRLLDKMQHGQFQIYGSSGWHADYPDPENFFMVFYGGNIPPAGANHGRYQSPEFDRLFEQMRAMDDGPERLGVIRELRDILSEDCPIILFSHPVVFSLAQPWMPRISDNGMARNGMKYVMLDPEVRAEKLAEWNRTTLWPLWLASAALAGMIGYGIVIGRKRDA